MNEKLQAHVYTLRSAKYNEIIYFVLSGKLREEIGLPQTLVNTQPNFQWQHMLVICFSQFYIK